MSKKTRRQERRKSPTTVDSQAKRKTQDARGPNGHRLKFYHPVTVLKDRAWNAWQSVTGLDDLRFCRSNERLNSWDSYGEPAQQALRLASSASHNSGRWLRYGLGQRAGVFETELRAVLRELESWIGVFTTPGINTPDDVCRRWRDNVAKLEALLTELDSVAVDPEELRCWYDELRACHGALTAVDKGMAELWILATKASDSLKGQLDYLLAHLIPSFRGSLAVVLPGLLYAHDSKGDAHCLRLDDLPSRLKMCAEDVARWGMQNTELGVTSEDRPFQANRRFATTREQAKGLLDYLERVLQELRLGDTSEARQIPLPKPAAADSAAEPRGDDKPATRHSSDLPVLSSYAAAVYEILLELPPHRGMTGPNLLDALQQRQIYIEQSTLTSRIIPELNPYGVENVPRKGYRIIPRRRPAE